MENLGINLLTVSTYLLE